MDRVFINELYKAYSQGKASEERGGYYFPMQYTEAELAAPGYKVDVAGQEDQGKFSVKLDLLNLVKDMRMRKLVAPL